MKPETNTARKIKQCNFQKIPINRKTVEKEEGKETKYEDTKELKMRRPDHRMAFSL